MPRLLAFLSLAAVAVAGCKASHESAVKGSGFSFNFPDLGGKPVSSGDPQFKGKVLLVDLWGTWCPPCRAEIPHLIRLQEKYREKGLVVVGIAFESSGGEEGRRAVEVFAKQQGINYAVLFGGRQDEVENKLPLLSPFGGFPTSVFIGRDGKIAKIETGFAPSMADELEKTIKDLL